MYMIMSLVFIWNQEGWKYFMICRTVKFLLCSPLGLNFSATFGEAEKIKVVGQKLRDRGFLHTLV
jgi:hypothetical protein